MAKEQEVARCDCPRCQGCVVQPGRRLNPVHEHVMCEHEAAFVERILAR